MRFVVRRRRKCDAPLRDGPLFFDDGLLLAIIQEQVVVFGRLDAPFQIDRIGAEVERGQVSVADFDGPLLGPVGEHGREREVGRLDGLHDVVTPAAPGGVGICLPSLLGDGSRTHKLSRQILFPHELGLCCLAHGPPGEVPE